MAANWYTDAEIKTTLEGMIGATGGSLTAHWTPIVSAANWRAIGQLMTWFRGLGYTDAQIETWGDKTSTKDYGANFQKFQALYWCGELGKALLTEASLAELQKLNVMPELQEIALTNGGEPVDPPPDAVVTGGVGHGAIAAAGRFTGANSW
jgi:hypothetical protein